MVLGLKMVPSLDLPQGLASKSTFWVQGGRSVVTKVWQEETSAGKPTGQGRGAVVELDGPRPRRLWGANQVWGVRPSTEAVLRGHAGAGLFEILPS